MASASSADRAHRGRPHHARRGPGQDHEADQRERADAPPRATARPGTSGPRTAPRPSTIATLAPLTAIEVGQPGGAEVLGQRRVEPAGVADDQARAAARPGAGGSGGRPAAARPAAGRPPAASTMDGPAVGARPVAVSTAAVRSPPRGGASRPVRGDPLARQQTAPRRVGGEDQHPRVEPHRRRPHVEPGQPGRDEVGGRPRTAAGQRPRVVGDGQLGPHRRVRARASAASGSASRAGRRAAVGEPGRTPTPSRRPTADQRHRRAPAGRAPAAGGARRRRTDEREPRHAAADGDDPPRRGASIRSATRQARPRRRPRSRPAAGHGPAFTPSPGSSGRCTGRRRCR